MLLGSGTLTVSTTGAGTFSGILSGTGGSFTKAGTGTLTLAGANTYTGATTVNGGTLAFSSAANLGAGTVAPVLNGGTLQFTDGAASLSYGLSVGSSGGTVNVSASTGSLTIGGAVSGTAGTLTKTGVGTLTLTTPFDVGGMAVSAGKVAYTPGQTLAGRIGTLSASGQLDVADNRLVLTSTPASNLRTMLQNGYNGGSWNGTISSVISSVAATASPQYTGIGWAAAGEVGQTSWAGVAVSSTDLLTRYTYYGDGGGGFRAAGGWTDAGVH